MSRLTKIMLGTVVVITVLVTAVIVLVLPRLNFAGFVAGRATETFGRSVSIDSIHVSPGLVLGVEIQGIRLGNIQGASNPAMATLASVSASVEWLPLLRGLVVTRRAEVDGLSLVLERNAQHQANWLLGTENPVTKPEQIAPPSDRGSMPVIRDVRIVRSQVTFRGSTGNEFCTRLDIATLSAADPDQPMRLDARGSYNDVPLTVAAKLGSANAFRNAVAPFPLDLHVASGENTLDFRATATDPLNVDGVEGEITVVAPTWDTVLDVVDAKVAPGSPINFSAHVTRQGDIWRLDQAAGSVDDKPFNLRFVQFVEGHGGHSGVVTGELDVPPWAGVVAGRQASLASLHISLNQSLRVELRGARLGNMPAGTDPAMGTLASFSAEIDAPSLMNGAVVVRHAEVDGLSLLLERTARHGDNWNFATVQPTAPVPAVPPGQDVQPAADPGPIPVIHDLRIVHSQVVFREITGREHRVRLDNVNLTAADQLSLVDATGSYNDLPLIIAAKLGGSSALRDTSAPFPLELHAASGENTLDLRGTVTDPQHAADIDGQIALAAPAPAALLDLAAVGGAPNLSVQFAGRLTRQGGNWRLDQASGAVNGNRFSLKLLQFVEGTASRPPALTGELDVPRLTTTVLGRHVSLESLRASMDNSLRVELRGARFGNVPGGSEPDMVRLESLNAEIEAEPLLRGSVVVRRAGVDGLSLLLEHNARHQANWHFGQEHGADAAAPTPAHTQNGAPPRDRGGLPFVHNLTISSSDILFRTSSGHALSTRLQRVTVTAPSADELVMLRGSGTYNGVPLTLDGTLGNLATLHDASTPFPMALHAASGKTTLVFHGTAADPLNIDGMQGSLTLDAPTADALIGIAGLKPGPQAAIHLAGTFTHSGDLWRLTQADGTLDGSPVKAPLLQLIEGASGGPDVVIADLDVGRLDLNQLLGPRLPAGGQKHGNADLPLEVDARPDPLVQVQLSVKDLSYAKLHATDARLKAEVAPGLIEVERLSLAAFDSQIDASGALSAVKRGTRIEAELHLTDGNVDTLRRSFGLRDLPLAGQIEGHMLASGEGRRLNEAALGGHFSAVLAMVGGNIARKAIEIASLDLRSLFRTARGTTPLACLLGVVDIQAGQGNASPLRIRADTGTISGLAHFDLKKKYLDLIIGSHHETTNFFALDTPVRISGRFDNPNIAPAKWSRDGRAQIANAKANVAALPPPLRDFALRSPCYWGNRQGL